MRVNRLFFAIRLSNTCHDYMSVYLTAIAGLSRGECPCPIIEFGDIYFKEKGEFLFKKQIYL